MKKNKQDKPIYLTFKVPIKYLYENMDSITIQVLTNKDWILMDK